MTTTDKKAATSLRDAADLVQNDNAALAALCRAEADRLDPPAPTGKTVEWRDGRYRLTSDAVEWQTSPGQPWMFKVGREFVDAVVLPLLADAPDGPIPDETVKAAHTAWLNAPIGSDAFRVLCEAVRGLPGMAVVRPGTPPEVLRWEVWSADNDAVATCATRAAAREFAQKFPKGTIMRVVAIIADPGEGTA